MKKLLCTILCSTMLMSQASAFRVVVLDPEDIFSPETLEKFDQLVEEHNPPAPDEIPTNTDTDTDDTAHFDAWATDIIGFAAENGLLVDSLGNDYTKDITRLQIADLLVNMVEKALGTSLVPAANDTFPDTTNGQVLKAYESVIIAGRSDGTFDPNAPATREEISIMIFNTIKVLEESAGALIDHENTTVSGFHDYDEAYEWAQPSLAILVNNELMSGFNGYLKPKDNTTIQECIVLNNNLFKLGE